MSHSQRISETNIKQIVDPDAKQTSATLPVAVFLISLVGPAIVLSLPSMLAWPADYLPTHLYLFGTLGQALMDLPAISIDRRRTYARLF